MKKFVILIIGLSFIAASCDLGLDSLSGSSGTRGVFKSEDNGETFNTADKLLPKNDISGVTVNSLAFDSSNPDIIYLGSSNGIFKSEDGAKTWRFILSGIGITDIVVDPYSSNIVYASGLSGSKGKIIKSQDKGSTWVDIFTEPSKTNSVTAITVLRSNNQIVLAGLNSGEIIRSTDSGHTWQAAKNLSDRVVSIRSSSIGTAYAMTAKNGLNKSTDNGVSWTPITASLTRDSLSVPGQIIISVSQFANLALDERQLGVVYLGTDQGLFRSVNDGANWSQLALPVKNSALLVSSVAVNPSNSNNLYAAIGSTVFKSINGGVSWQTKVLPTNAVIRVIKINPQSQNIIYLGMNSK